ncbi:single-stranded-DNA-specific exonuclease RecJ [Paenibacillus beijingensis]|uniref:Single-stranded-DNA-specific exonuclease RecJ n=1 Tax=Paenibacillus beijingensis TaxID=1126833 RepID=A0A0D5NLQ9_9BACL|nr:single-stranded-DNA-specific exonuclease RecJ [Paenibacillus beijingensis]AJY76095.1 hypothetical protein VN24_17930 [Paenibacillus beijingensis]
MIKSKTRWLVKGLDAAGEQQAAHLGRELKLPPLVARLLVQRGYEDPAKAQWFLSAGAEDMHDPMLLLGMEQAAARIRQAAQSGEKVRIYGDYDADGVSSTALLLHVFRRLGIDADYYIPHRTREGYGLNNDAILRSAEAGITLLVTVDTGVSAAREVEYAQQLGMDVIVTDHHEPPAVLPQPLALVNPKQPGCPYPFKGLAGAGVAFKLAHALLGRPPLELADIAALGTIADLMPLTGENRILVRCGLETMRSGSRTGLRALAEAADVSLGSVSASDVAFFMAPRINAAGRLKHASEAVVLLTTEDAEQAGNSAAVLDLLNRERQHIVDEMTKEAEELWQVRKRQCIDEGLPEPGVIVLAAEGWNPGVIGIVASKLLERHYKPAVILGIDAQTGMCKGSARSIDGFDMYAALTECAGLMDHFGGHQAAAGMSLHRDRLPEFEQTLCACAARVLKAEDLIPKTLIDLECALSEATLETIGQLSQLEPFGSANPAPRLLINGARLAERRVIGKERNHLKLLLGGVQGADLDAIGFGLGWVAGRLEAAESADVIGELSVNEWNGRRKPQLLLRDLRVSELLVYDRRNETEPLASLRRIADDAAAGGSQLYVVGDEGGLPETASALQLGDSKKHADETGSIAGFYTYEALPADLSDCRELALIGRPPAIERLAAFLSRCPNLEAVHAMYRTAGPAGFPQREHFGAVYQLLRRAGEIPAAIAPDRLASQTGWPKEAVEMMLGVFKELELVTRLGGAIAPAASPRKRELDESALYRDWRQRTEEAAVLQAPLEELARWMRKQLHLTERN